MSAILDFLFPRLCHLCDSPLAPHEQYVCSHCLSRLPRSGFHRVRMNGMEQRFAGIFPFDCATGHFLYSRSSPLSQLIQDFKYRRFPGLARHLGQVIAEELFITPFFEGIDMIVPIPMHFVKKALRGYNQTEWLARGISDVTGIRVAPLLKACRGHKTQTAMTLAQRRHNLDGIFALTSPTLAEGKGILLLDDVCTTGTTITEAALTLLGASHPSRLKILTAGVTF